jgi:sterol desaturase/sphingolipid hydroxylase (fatty acid hydroxylase superfamily)
VNSWDHHVHHLKPRKNLAHFFVLLDKVMGTYQDPMEMANIVITK